MEINSRFTMETSSGYWIVESIDSSSNSFAKKNSIKKLYNSSGLWIVENCLSKINTRKNSIKKFSLNRSKLPEKIQIDLKNCNSGEVSKPHNWNRNTSDSNLSIANSKISFTSLKTTSNFSQSSTKVKNLPKSSKFMIKNQSTDDKDDFSGSDSEEDSDLLKNFSNYFKLIKNNKSNLPSSAESSSTKKSVKVLSKEFIKILKDQKRTDSSGLIKETNFRNSKPSDNLLAAITEENLTEVIRIINSFGLAHDPEWLNGYYLLCHAIQHKSKEITKFLLEKNAEVNSPVEKLDNSPLHLAVLQNDDEIVEILLVKKADVNKKNFQKQSPLDSAIIINNTVILKLLVDHMSDLNISEENYVKLLLHLFDQDYIQLTESLLSKCSSINLNAALKNYNLLCRAVEKENYSIAKSLIERGVDINSSFSSFLGSRTALYIACEKGNFNLAKLLLSSGADVSEASEIFNFQERIKHYPIRAAIAAGHFLIVKILLDYKADINRYDGEFSPLHLACNFCQTEIVKLLVHYGADINVKNDLGLLPISFAAKRGYADIFKCLIEHEDFCLDFKNAEIILDAAAKNNFFKILMLLMDYINKLGPKDDLRLEIEAKIINNSDSPLLHTAARFGFEDCIEILVQSGAVVDMKDQDGKTPLHVAYQYGNQKSVICLLENGADINEISNEGYTPFEYYQISKHNCRLSDLDKQDINSFFAKQVAMMKILNLYVNTKNYNAFVEINNNKPDNLFPQQEEYEIEAAVMKTDFIVPSSTITYYNFVKAKPNLMARHLNNENILETLKARDYNLVFPNYSDIIGGCFQNALERKNLLDEAEECTFFDCIQELPYPCVDKITNYFRNSDLKILINKNKFLDNKN